MGDFCVYLGLSDLGACLRDTKPGLHDTDMLGSCAAASAHKLYPCRYKLAGIARHVLGREQVDIASLHRAGDSRVRLGGDVRGGGASQSFDGVKHRHWAHAAVTTDHVGAPLLNAGTKDLGRGSVEAG